jgi:DNA-binding PadR family transcriptional regulator
LLTELDNCVLGVIWREGPMSAYGVRSHFAASTTVSWSSSTGTIYPAIRRLIAAGLLQAGERTGPRRRQLLTVTGAGLDAIRSWLVTVSPELGSSTADPVRTRVHFLSALPPEKRREVLATYRAASEAALRELDAYAGQPATTAVEKSEHLGTLGAQMELRARLSWLDLVERELDSLAGPDSTA